MSGQGKWIAAGLFLGVSILAVGVALIAPVPERGEAPVPTAEALRLVHFTDANFKREVLDRQGVVVVDFYADWCGPCRMVGPVIEELAGEFAGAASIGKFDVDANPQVAGALGISSIPAVIVFRDGRPVERLIGVQTRERYAQAVREAMKG